MQTQKLKKLLGTGNSKLNETSKELGVKILNFSIPAGNDKISGKITCPFAGKCFHFCYAKEGAYAWSNVQFALHERFEATKETNFGERIISQIKKLKTDKQIYIRIHDSGDFYSPTYFQTWLNIINLLPNVRFYAYTKSHSFIRNKFIIPNNLDLIYSLGGTKDELIDTNIERHSRIFNTKEELYSEGYIDSSKIDLLATKWFSENNKVGLVLH
jgi:hypothetical protein